jgi:hypothetical protein
VRRDFGADWGLACELAEPPTPRHGRLDPKDRHGPPGQADAGHAAAEAWADCTAALHAGKKPPQGTPAGGRQAEDGPVNQTNCRGAIRE